MRNSLTVAASTLLVVLVCTFSFSDTVILKNGTRKKGLILDEFDDRIVLSTVEGEKTIMRGEIRSAVYDNEEKALMQKAKNHTKRNQPIKAYYVYKKIVELNPDHKEAREKMENLRNVLESQARNDMIDAVVKKPSRVVLSETNDRSWSRRRDDKRARAGSDSRMLFLKHRDLSMVGQLSEPREISALEGGVKIALREGWLTYGSSCGTSATDALSHCR